MRGKTFPLCEYGTKISKIADYFKKFYAHHFTEDAAPKLIASRVHDLQRKHETKLLQPLLSYLKQKDNLRVLGSTSVEDRVPTVAIDVKERGKQIAIELAKDGVMSDCGDFYAVRLLEALGVDRKYGVLRLSFVHYTSEQDVEKLIDSLEKFL